jgi:hypothetical protein
VRRPEDNARRLTDDRVHHQASSCGFGLTSASSFKRRGRTVVSRLKSDPLALAVRPWDHRDRWYSDPSARATPTKPRSS